MAYKIQVEVAFLNSLVGAGVQKHISSIELPHAVPQDFKNRYMEQQKVAEPAEPSYATFKEAMIQSVVNGWGGDGRFAVLSNDDGQDHLIINRDDIEYVKVSIVKTIDKV